MENAKEELAFIEKGLLLDMDNETRGVLLLNKATTLHRLGNTDEGIKLLNQLKDDKSQTIFTRTSAGEILKVIK